MSRAVETFSFNFSKIRRKNEWSESKIKFIQNGCQIHIILINNSFDCKINDDLIILINPSKLYIYNKSTRNRVRISYVRYKLV